MIPVEEVLQHLLGTWSLVSWEEWGPDGTVNYPLGEDAVMIRF